MKVPSADFLTTFNCILRYLEFVLSLIVVFLWCFLISIAFTEFEDLFNHGLRHLLARTDEGDEASKKREELKYTTGVSHQIEEIVDSSLVIYFVRIKSEYNLLEDSGWLSPPPFYRVTIADFLCLEEFILHRILSYRQESFFWLNCVEACVPVDWITIVCFQEIRCPFVLFINGFV